MALFGDWSRGDIFADDSWFGGIRDNKGVHADVRNGVQRGTFWKGQDGNVYVAGENGVNNAGRWDNNTIDYWTNQAYKYEADPNRAKAHQGDTPQGSPYGNLQLDPGGGNRASAAQLREYDQGIDETNHNLGRINTQLGIRRANINDAWKQKSDALDSSIARARNQYDTQRTQNMQQRRNEVNVINDRASGDLRRLLRLLGGRGGGGSDTEKIARAVQDKANQERAGSSTAYAKNAQTLDTNWYNFNQDAEKERKGINDWKVNEERQATAQAETNRQGLLGYLAQLKSQKAEAMGQNGANAARADLGAARALSEKIDQLGRVQTTHTGKDPIYQPKSLDSYKVGSNTTVGVSHNNSQADDTTANVYTTKQTEDEERKKRNQWL